MSPDSDGKVILFVSEGSSDEIAFFIRQNTKEMRSDSSEYWLKFNQELKERDVEPDTCTLVDRIPCGGSLDEITEEYGVLILGGGAIIEFEFSDNKFARWHEVTRSYQTTEFNEEIEIALRIHNEGI